MHSITGVLAAFLAGIYAEIRMVSRLTAAAAMSAGGEGQGQRNIPEEDAGKVFGNNGNDQSDADDSDRNTDGDADHAYAESFKQYRIAQLLCRGSHGREDAELLCPFIQ